MFSKLVADLSPCIWKYFEHRLEHFSPSPLTLEERFDCQLLTNVNEVHCLAINLIDISWVKALWSTPVM